MVSVKYDKNVNAFYFKLHDAKIAKTLQIGKDRFMDISTDGKIVGIEILNEFNMNSFDFVEAVKKTKEIEITA